MFIMNEPKPEKLKTQGQFHERFKLDAVRKSSFYIKHGFRNRKRAPIAFTNHIYLDALVYYMLSPPNQPKKGYLFNCTDRHPRQPAQTQTRPHRRPPRQLGT